MSLDRLWLLLCVRTQIGIPSHQAAHCKDPQEFQALQGHIHRAVTFIIRVCEVLLVFSSCFVIYRVVQYCRTVQPAARVCDIQSHGAALRCPACGHAASGHSHLPEWRTIKSLLLELCYSRKSSSEARQDGELLLNTVRCPFILLLLSDADVDHPCKTHLARHTTQKQCRNRATLRQAFSLS